MRTNRFVKGSIVYFCLCQIFNKRVFGGGDFLLGFFEVLNRFKALCFLFPWAVSTGLVVASQEACQAQLAELNPYVQVELQKGPIDSVEELSLVVLTEKSQSELFRWGSWDGNGWWKWDLLQSCCKEVLRCWWGGFVGPFPSTIVQ